MAAGICVMIGADEFCVWFSGKAVNEFVVVVVASIVCDEFVVGVVEGDSKFGGGNGGGDCCWF